jgi:hypothetical protein
MFDDDDAPMLVRVVNLLILIDSSLELVLNLRI